VLDTSILAGCEDTLRLLVRIRIADDLEDVQKDARASLGCVPEDVKGVVVAFRQHDA
jgi:hypothetical protein